MIQKYKFNEPDVKVEDVQEPEQTGLDLGLSTKKKDYEWPD